MGCLPFPRTWKSGKSAGHGLRPRLLDQVGRHRCGLGLALAIGLLALTAVLAYQVRAIIRHPHSAVRAIEALAITVPVFLLLFAATYFMMEQSNPDNFNIDSLTRTDS